MGAPVLLGSILSTIIVIIIVWALVMITVRLGHIRKMIKDIRDVSPEWQQYEAKEYQIAEKQRALIESEAVGLWEYISANPVVAVVVGLFIVFVLVLIIGVCTT